MKQLCLNLSVVALLIPTAAYSANKCEAIFGPEVSSVSDVNLFGTDEKDQWFAVRQGRTAAHINLDSSDAQPNIFFAFPEGNSGTALWFDNPQSNANLKFSNSPREVSGSGNLHGFEVNVRASTTELVLQDVVLGTMRDIRDRELNAGQWSPGHQMPMADKVVQGRKILMHQKSTNRKYDYILEVEVLGDTSIVQNGSEVRLTSPSEVKIKVTSMTNETQLTPIPLDRIFKPEFLAKADPKRLEALSFLFYEEKLMAGSPRYFSLFGRDSLISTTLLMEHMLPEGIEKVLGANFSAMNPRTGQASHETHEGEFAAKERRQKHQKFIGIDDAIHDYKMIDDDFLLANLMLRYIKAYPERSKTFVEQKDARGFEIKSLVMKNFDLVNKKTAAFAKNPVYSNLIHLTPGHSTGQWRDSENGLGGGIYPFDVNVAFVPGTLKNMRDVLASKQTPFYDVEKANEYDAAFNVWNSKALPLFMVRIEASQAAKYAEPFLKRLGLDPANFAAAPKEDIVFPGISLDKNGVPVPIMHSDDSMMMSFGHPSKEYLKIATQRLTMPFPYGLTTPVGVLVANPVFAPVELQMKFGAEHYHGMVSWAMVEDVYNAGLSRQLARPDLDANLKQDLARSKQIIQHVLNVKSSLGGVEVVTIIYKNGKAIAQPFKGDAKSNPLQLWSYLGLGAE